MCYIVYNKNHEILKVLWNRRKRSTLLLILYWLRADMIMFGIYWSTIIITYMDHIIFLLCSLILKDILSWDMIPESLWNLDLEGPINLDTKDNGIWCEEKCRNVKSHNMQGRIGDQWFTNPPSQFYLVWFNYLRTLVTQFHCYLNILTRQIL